MHVGEALKSIRTTNGLSVEEFAYNILLDPEEQIEIEIGNRQPEPETLSLISNLYNLDITKLEQGQIEQRPSRNELLEAMQEIREEISRMKEDNKYFRDFIEKWGLQEEMNDKRYQPKDISETVDEAKESEYNYAILDTLTGNYITEPDGSIKTWEYGIDAHRIANAMNQETVLESQNGAQSTNIDDIVQPPKDVEYEQDNSFETFLELNNAVMETYNHEQKPDTDGKNSPVPKKENEISPKI